MASFEDLLGKFIVSVIMISSIFLFVVTVQSDNNAEQPIAENAMFNNSLQKINNQIENATSEAQEKYGTFNSEEPEVGLGSIVLVGIVSVGKTFSSIVFGFFAAVAKLPLVVLGIPASIYNLLITWLIIIVIVAAWLLYKFG